MITIYVQGVALPIDPKLLLVQVATLGDILGPPARHPTPHEIALLGGVWHMLHEILDRTQATQPTATTH